MRSNLVLSSAVVLVAAAAATASAQEAITGPVTRIDFTGYAGRGLVPTPGAGQLDSDTWKVLGMDDATGAFGGTFTSGDFAEGASTGNAVAGGLLAFSVATGDPAFGFQQTGTDLTPGAIFVRFVNATAEPLVDPTIRWEAWAFNNEDRSSEVEFAWSDDGSNFAAIDSLRVTSPELAAATPSWQVTTRQATLTGTTLAVGQRLTLRWSPDSNTGSGEWDELAIDDIEVAFAVAEPPPEPEPEPDGGVPDAGGDGPADDPSGDGDRDDDGVADALDNCPSVSNPAQFDDDEDGAGNACDYLGGSEEDSGFQAGCDASGGAGAGAGAASGLLLVLGAITARRRRRPSGASLS